MQDPWDDAGIVSAAEKRALAALVAEALRHDPESIKVEVDGRTFYAPKKGPDVYLVGLRLDDAKWACVIFRPAKGVHNPSGPPPRESAAIVLEPSDFMAAPLVVELRDDLDLGVSA